MIRHDDAAAIELRLESPAAPTFSVAALDLLDEIFAAIRAAARRPHAQPSRYLLLTSAGAGIFSMGGDLQTIAELARAGDGEGAARYGAKAADIVYALYDGLGCDLVTVACVSGKAFGAGFEAALACHRVAACRTATFCLPESRFGLFPGMGATSLLARRIGREAMERLIGERTVLSAADAHADGLVAAVTEADPVALELRLARDGGPRRHRDLMEAAAARRALEAFTLDEVRGTTAIWAERVASMAPADLEALERVARVQKARRGVPAA